MFSARDGAMSSDELGTAVCVLFAILFVFGMWWSCRKERSFLREYKSREAQGDAAFYEEYYRDSDVPDDIPRRLRPIYAGFFGLDPLRLQPWDRPPEIGEMDAAQLVDAIEREFGMSISDKDAESIDGSFNSIVQYVAKFRAN